MNHITALADNSELIIERVILLLCIFALSMFYFYTTFNLLSLNMKHLSLVILVLCACMIAGCDANKKDNNHMDVITINPSAPSAASVDEIFESHDIVHLHKDTSAIYLNIVQIVKASEEFIYVSDGESLYKFDMTGNLAGKISKLGAGHNEYNSITNFAFDTDESVWILSRHNKKLIHYDWKGSVLDNITIANDVKDICVVDEDHVLMYKGNELDGNGSDRLLVLNLKTKEVEKSYLSVNEDKAKYLFVSLPGNFSSNGGADGAMLFDLYNDTIYRCGNDIVTPQYVLKFTKHQIPQEFYNQEFYNIREFVKSVQSNNYLYATSIFGETRDNLFVSYYHEMNMHVCMIPKEGGACMDFSSLTDFDHLDGYTANLIRFPNVFFSRGKMIFQLDMLEITDDIKENLGEEKFNETMEYLNGTDITGTFLFVGKAK